MMVTAKPFSAFQLNELALRVCGPYLVEDIAKGLDEGGAVEAATRIVETARMYGILRKGDWEKNDYWERGYRDSYYKKAAPGLEIARVLLGDHLNERDREPSRAESRLYKFLQIKEQEMVEAGVLQHIAEDDDDEDGQQGRKGKRKGRRRNKGAASCFARLLLALSRNCHKSLAPCRGRPCTPKPCAAHLERLKILRSCLPH